MTTKIPGTFDGKVRIDNRRARMLGGAALIAVGAFAIFSQFADVHLLALLIVPLTGLLLLTWGAAVRGNGLLIAGGILFGIGVGLALNQTLLSGFNDSIQAGVLLISFAAGWFMITILSFFFARKRLWWPLIPGVLCLVVGVGMLLNKNNLVESIGRFWPALLIIAGLIAIIYRRKK